MHVGKVEDHATVEKALDVLCVCVFAPHFRSSDGRLKWGQVQVHGNGARQGMVGAQKYAGRSECVCLGLAGLAGPSQEEEHESGRSPREGIRGRVFTQPNTHRHFKTFKDIVTQEETRAIGNAHVIIPNSPARA